MNHEQVIRFAVVHAKAILSLALLGLAGELGAAIVITFYPGAAGLLIDGFALGSGALAVASVRPSSDMHFSLDGLRVLP